MSASALPAPYPDELACSVIARHVRYTGYIHDRLVLRELQLEHGQTMNVIAPTQLKAVALLCGMSSQRRFAANHTLLPYYLSAYPGNVWEEAVCERTGKLSGASINDHLAWSKPGEPSHLRYCVDCVHLDCVRYGETYWHRAHQLPGVTRCARHRRVLYLSDHPFRVRDLPKFWAAPHQALRAIPSRRASHIFSGQLADSVEEQSLRLLSTGLSAGCFLSTANYLGGLQRLGLADRRRRVRIRQFESLLRAFLRASGARLDSLGGNEWWLDLFRESARARVTVMQHLVLQEFMAQSDRIRATQPDFEGELTRVQAKAEDPT